MIRPNIRRPGHTRAQGLPPRWRRAGAEVGPARRKRGRPPSEREDGPATLGLRIQGAKETSANYEDLAAREADPSRRELFLARARQWEARAVRLIGQRNAGAVQGELFAEV